MFYRLALLGSLGSLFLCAQNLHTIKGIVVDEDGRPISGAYVDFEGGPAFWGQQTNAEGRFQIETSGPFAVVRRANYRSERIQTDTARDARITLHSAGRTIALCRTNRGCDLGGFCFPKVPGVSQGHITSDIDFYQRTYWIARTKGGLPGFWQSFLWLRPWQGMSHGLGPSYTRGVPSLRDVAQSAKYHEVGLAVEGDQSGIENPIGIVDATGADVSGKRWRYLGVVAESAQYREMPVDAARLLDRMLDGVCIRQPR